MIEIADHIFYVEGENRGKYPDCHCLFVRDDVSAIIDPACREDLMHELASEHDVAIVLNTHYHEDHRIYNYLFENARLLAHELDVHGYGSVEHFMNGFSLANSEYHKELWKVFLLETCKYRPYTVEESLTDGTEIDFGHTRAQVVHTPGHSSGHCCFFFPREGILYLGDIDLTSFGPWYASHYSDIGDFLASIEKVRGLQPRVVITSHGDGLITENIGERLTAYADVIHRRDDGILDFLSQPRRVEEIYDLEIVYRRNQKTPESFFYWDDRWMIDMHLERLKCSGRIKEEGGNYSLA